MLRSAQNDNFASGSALYQYRSQHPDGRDNRIFVNIAIENTQTTAALDTGGAYLIIDPNFAAGIGLVQEDGDIEQIEGGQRKPRLSIRGHNFVGVYHRVTVRLLASEGQSCDIDATAFVPDLSEQEAWEQLDLPHFLGFYNCLDRIRFAIDPFTDHIYFGSDSDAD